MQREHVCQIKGEMLCDLRKMMPMTLICGIDTIKIKRHHLKQCHQYNNTQTYVYDIWYILQTHIYSIWDACVTMMCAHCDGGGVHLTCAPQTRALIHHPSPTTMRHPTPEIPTWHMSQPLLGCANGVIDGVTSTEAPLAQRVQYTLFCSPCSTR